MQECQGKGLKGKMEHYGLSGAAPPRLSEHRLSTLVQWKDGRGWVWVGLRALPTQTVLGFSDRSSP